MIRTYQSLAARCHHILRLISFSTAASGEESVWGRAGKSILWRPRLRASARAEVCRKLACRESPSAYWKVEAPMIMAWRSSRDRTVTRRDSSSMSTAEMPQVRAASMQSSDEANRFCSSEDRRQE